MTIKISLTKKELWELMNGFDASFMSGEEGNELAEKVSAKLHRAYNRELDREKLVE